MDNRIFSYLIIFSGIIASVASLLTLSIYLIAFSSAISISSLFIYKLWDLVEAIVIKKTNVVQMLGEYELEGERLTATRHITQGFTATAAAVLKEQPSKMLSRENVERIISNSNSPFRFVVQAERLDESKIIDRLKTTRRLKEIELSKIIHSKESGKAKDKVIEREIEAIENEINAISSGATPLKMDIYLMSSAISDSKFVAEERARNQVKGLAGEFSAVLGAWFEPVTGSELVRLLSMDSTCNPGR